MRFHELAQFGWRDAAVPGWMKKVPKVELQASEQASGRRAHGIVPWVHIGVSDSVPQLVIDVI